MTWNVYRENFNQKEIVVFNVFDHWRFADEVSELKKDKRLTIGEFSEELRRLAMYYFWSKCEHEIVVTTFPPYITAEERERLNKEDEEHLATYGAHPYRHNVRLCIGSKIDIYQQLQLNWKAFVEYVWSAKE